MNSQDFRVNPNTAPVFTSHTRQPYARRTISFFFWLGLIVLGAAFLIGWFYSPQGDSEEKQSDLAVIEGQKSGALAGQNRDMPGNEYADGSAQNGLYDFFYALFSGASEGLEDNPHNLKNVERIDDFNLDKAMAGDPIFMNNIKPAAGELAASSAAAAMSQSEDRYTRFDGKILDYEGNISGDIAAIEYDDGKAKRFKFVLDSDLAPDAKQRHFMIPSDEVKIVQSDTGAFFIQLDKKQTQALAAQLYD